MRNPYSFTQLSSDSVSLYTPKTYRSKSISLHLQQHHHSYSLNHFEPWARPVYVHLDIKPDSQNVQRRDTLLKQRKLSSNLKYRKLIGDRVRKNSLQQKQGLDRSLDKGVHLIRCTTHSQTRKSSESSVDSIAQIQTIKQTLHSACQSKPIKLQSRPVSSKRAQRAEVTEPLVKTSRMEELFKRVRRIAGRGKKSQTSQQLTGW